LRAVDLPRTISDAILVCEKLGHQYLWIDSLCIIQDNFPEKLSAQLDQMADICHRAVLILVAATGDHAGHGLAGVSLARKINQVFCEFGTKSELVTCSPALPTLLQKSKWWTRAWTYQEYLVSKILLFFTDDGLYLKTGPHPSNNVVTDSASLSLWTLDHRWNLAVIEAFTQRTLTYDTDMVNAASGILRAMYGDRTSYGMPWDYFNIAIHWHPSTFNHGLRMFSGANQFPSWSEENRRFLEVRDLVVTGS
jgi:hypothetical protein